MINTSMPSINTTNNNTMNMSLSNATYRRNARRHYHQQKQKMNSMYQMRKKTWERFFALSRFRMNGGTTGGTGGGGGSSSGVWSPPSSSSSSSSSNFGYNRFSWKKSPSFFRFMSFSDNRNGNGNGIGIGIGNKKTKRKQRFLVIALVSLLLICLYLWSSFVYSILTKSRGGDSTIQTQTQIQIQVDMDTTSTRTSDSDSNSISSNGIGNSNVNVNGSTNNGSSNNSNNSNSSSQQFMKTAIATTTTMTSKNKGDGESTNKADSNKIIVHEHKVQQLRSSNNHNHDHKSNENEAELKLGFIHETGAWANCTKEPNHGRQQPLNKKHQHPDERTTIVSCHSIQYRIKSSIFSKYISDNNNDNDMNKDTNKNNIMDNQIIIGVLSSGDNHLPTGTGYSRRQSIRDTWAKDHFNVFFIVAHPFSLSDHSNHNSNATPSTTNRNSSGSGNESKNENANANGDDNSTTVPSLAMEYDMYNDLLWIDEEEIYQGEKSVLTYKTLSFITIVYDLITEQQQKQQQKQQKQQKQQNDISLKHIFKTDDDSYVHVQNLYHHLTSNDNGHIDYWGQCNDKQVEPLRSKSNKWPVSYELYPEKLYPRYCQGAGFALSWRFIQCASSPRRLLNENDNNNDNDNDNSHNQGTSSSNIANARYMPFEDVATGLIAQRCNIRPQSIADKNWMNMYRFGRSEEVWRVNQGMKRMPKWKLPKPNMDNGRFVQHRIYDDWDMKEHHKVVVDKLKYNEESDVEWYYRPDKR